MRDSLTDTRSYSGLTSRSVLVVLGTMVDGFGQQRVSFRQVAQAYIRPSSSAQLQPPAKAHAIQLQSSTIFPPCACRLDHSINWQKKTVATIAAAFHGTETGVAIEVLFSPAMCIGGDDLFCLDFVPSAGTGRLPSQVNASAMQAPLQCPYACTKSQLSSASRLYLQTHPSSPPARSRGTKRSPISQPRQMK
jgi:hypothetical protein